METVKRNPSAGVLAMRLADIALYQYGLVIAHFDNKAAGSLQAICRIALQVHRNINDLKYAPYYGTLRGS
jgi:hypothetical protein